MPDEICTLTRKVNDLIAHLEHHHTRTEVLISLCENLRLLVLDSIRKNEESSRYITEDSLANVVRKLVIVNKFVKNEEKRLRTYNFLFNWVKRWLKLE